MSETYMEKFQRETAERWEASCLKWIKRSTQAEELLKFAAARVSLANSEGEPILSAWLPGAEKFLATCAETDAARTHCAGQAVAPQPTAGRRAR